MCKIILQNGDIIDNLELNGNNYISKVLIEDAVFKENLGTVTIDGVELHDMKLIQNKIYGTESWFILAEKTKEEVEKEEMLQLIADLTETVLLGGI